MIKLTNYLPYEVTKEEYISKSCIHSMERKDDMTAVCMQGGYSLRVKETPEEILAMPDIEDTAKPIDWEQRRYELIKEFMGQMIGREGDSLTYEEFDATLDLVDNTIESLKKGQNNEN